MSRFAELFKRRAFLISIAVLAITIVVGTAISGPNFLINPLPISQWWANTWLTFNCTLALITMAIAYRTLLSFEDRWTWQEIAVVRGICWMLTGAAIGYSAHLLTHVGFVTMGTPAITLGMLSILYGMLRTPVRFDLQD